MRILGILAILTALHGCTSGRVLDALTGTALESAVTEVMVGNCVGAGCTGSPVKALTDSYGWYVFDAYKSASRQWLVPATGQEALGLRISKDGYQPVTIFHRPKYQNFPTAGGDYLATVVGTVYMCLLSSVDTDGDSICDEAEVRYGTNPEVSDTDGDSLSDAAEKFGYDGVDLKYFGANPLRKDVFLEIDYFPDRQPQSGAIQKVVDAFAMAPVPNPDGSTGINLIIDVSDKIAVADADQDLNPVWSEFDVIKNKYFAARRAPIFRYGLFANQYSSGASSGIASGFPGHDFIVTLGTWSVPGGTLIQQAGTLMHEFGHNFGMHHGGNDSVNYKPNYLSIMSYNYQIWGLRVDGEDGVLDYSRLRIGALNESSLNEVTAMSPVSASGTTEAILSHYGVFSRGWLNGSAAENLDFNRNSIIEEWVQVDLDGNGGAQGIFNASQNDWDTLRYNAGGSIGDSHLGNTHFLERRSVIPEENVEQCMTEFEVELE